jgi:PiT family inorganic phosphate transporter
VIAAGCRAEAWCALSVPCLLRDRTVTEVVVGVGTALTFAFVSGVNDGATLLALGLPNAAWRPLKLVLALTAAVALVPLAGGVRVAQTVADGLVSFEGRGGELTFLAAVLASLLVAIALANKGLPTSLTLALVGAIVGAGLARGSPVSWSAVLAVLLIGLAAPMASGVLGFGVARGLCLLPRRHVGELMRVLGTLAFFAQATAYAMNDAQKMIAVLAVALGLGPHGRVTATLTTQLLLGAAFGLGSLVGIDRFAWRLGQGVFRVRAVHSISSELASASAVFVSAWLASPVSTTQASTAGVVGAGASETRWRIRWDQAGRIATAWVVTLPTAAVAGAAAGLLLSVLR